MEIAKADGSSATATTSGVNEPRIDRHALTQRHNPTLTQIDPSAPLMVGNGNIAFTADITGLQTFPGSILCCSCR